MARNTRAIRLYERMGFSVEGRPLSLARPPAGRRPARGPLMKTVKESRHPFVYVFLMAA
jgi:ribosomal protein S18 acetylase RimI-like enzyme